VQQSTIARIESGARQPSLPVLARILAAVGLEPRISLEAYDEHDDVLNATAVRVNETQRAARRVAQDEFATELRPDSGA
jgi:transcriptional regulator with XRE-family HTH domain